MHATYVFPFIYVVNTIVQSYMSFNVYLCASLIAFVVFSSNVFKYKTENVLNLSERDWSQ